MASYHIRKYQERDRKSVLALFSQGMEEHIPSAFRHLLRQPQTLLLLPGVPLVLLFFSGSWLLALLASLAVLVVLRLAASYPWKKYVALSLQSDMADITKSYLRGSGSCFWVAESEGQVVGTVGALPVQDPTLREKQLQLFHLSVALEHRGQGLAKALVRTVIQFARARGYSEVMLDTTTVQTAALSLYQGMGFEIKHQCYFHVSARLVGLSSVRLVYRLPSSQGGGLCGSQESIDPAVVTSPP
ncbi:putative N-acetyltransferase 8B [Oryctolagus cuniculus]|uniref:putative N-acetyltransferase 8B n=1 Tax=Oryctolagus cuniculus TaxID=9986 RepID=UPI0038794992